MIDAGALLAEALHRPVVGDGATGTLLQAAGHEPGAPGEAWNVDHPERVEAVHRAYVEAGSEWLLTNTFGASRPRLARHGLGARAGELNRAGAEVALRAAGGEAAVLGDVGPFGGILAPLGDGDPDEVHAAFLEQSRALVEAGVSGIVVETMTSTEEVRLAVGAAREAGAGVVIASMAFDATRRGPHTMMGVTPEEAARAMTEAGADALGANCGAGLGLEDFAPIVEAYRRVAPGAVVLVQANAGTPSWAGGRAVYPETPEEMARQARELARAGGVMVGGCCGTTPAHVRALARALRG